MNKLILQLEINEYLKGKSIEMVKEIKNTFPEIGNVKVVINVWVGPPRKDKR